LDNSYHLQLFKNLVNFIGYWFFLKDLIQSKIENTLNQMANRDYRIERDSRGRERLVRSSSHREGGFHGRGKTTRELLNEAEEREQVLNGEVLSLQTQLSYAQRDNWQLQTIVNEHQQCRHIRAQLDAQVREVGRLEDLLADEDEDTGRLRRKYEDLKEKYRVTKSKEEEYRLLCTEKVAEVEVLRRRLADQVDLARLQETRITERNRTIAYLKNYLRTHGFHVAD
jgi:chromosome segregation ATPase